jgi:hypothetical protein
MELSCLMTISANSSLCLAVRQKKKLRRYISVQGRLFFRNEDIAEEYSLVQEKGDYARDAWRAVIYFLRRHGYKLTKDGQPVNFNTF